MRKLHTNRGYTLEEILIVMGIMALLSGFITINLIGAKHMSSMNTTIMNFISDLKYQQTKSMLGDTEGGADNYPYGIHFEGNSYTLFRGAIYNPSDTANFNVKLGDNIEFSNILFPDSQLVFTPGTGEIADFVPAYEILNFINQENNDQKTMKVNKYGVVTEVN